MENVEKLFDMLAEILAREKMHTQILMSIAYRGADDETYNTEMALLESRISQIKEALKRMD
jgi:hypothetical protein